MKLANVALPKSFRRAARSVNRGYQAARNGINTAVVLGMASAPGLALAQAADPAAAIQAEIAGVKASVGAILVVLAGVIGLMVLWSYIRRAK